MRIVLCAIALEIRQNPGNMYAERTGLDVSGRYLRVVPLKTYSHRWIDVGEIQVIHRNITCYGFRCNIIVRYCKCIDYHLLVGITIIIQSHMIKFSEFTVEEVKSGTTDGVYTNIEDSSLLTNIAGGYLALQLYIITNGFKISHLT